MPSNPTFLNIPQELRDIIIKFAVDTHTTAPPNAEVAGQYSELQDVQYHSTIKETKRKNVLYLATPCISACQSLLRVNKGLQLQTLTELPRLKLDFQLDVMLVQEYELWATWTSYVPIFVPNVDRVHVSFRIFPESKADSFGRGWNEEPKYWELYALLERVLRCGPTSTPVKQDRGFQAIQNLDLDVITPTGITEEQYDGLGFLHDREAIESTENSIHAKRAKDLLTTIERTMGVLLDISQDTTPVGCILLGKVGKVRIKLDGDLQREWDLAQHLTTMAYGNYHRHAETPMGWYRKLEAVYEKRRAAGLPCITNARLIQCLYPS